MAGCPTDSARNHRYHPSKNCSCSFAAADWPRATCSSTLGACPRFLPASGSPAVPPALDPPSPREQRPVFRDRGSVGWWSIHRRSFPADEAEVVSSPRHSVAVAAVVGSLSRFPHLLPPRWCRSTCQTLETLCCYRHLSWDGRLSRLKNVWTYPRQLLSRSQSPSWSFLQKGWLRLVLFIERFG